LYFLVRARPTPGMFLNIALTDGGTGTVTMVGEKEAGEAAPSSPWRTPKPSASGFGCWVSGAASI
jgi:hypothetical protein